jgi:hypothetical protein
MAGGRDPNNPMGQANNGYTGLLDGHARTVFNPALAVNTTEDSINLGPDHGFDTGDAVVYRAGGGAAIGGLVDGETYYVIATDDPELVQLAASQGDALDGKVLGLDAAPATGNQHVLVSRTGDIAGAADGEIDSSAPSGRRPRRRAVPRFRRGPLP